MGFHRSIRVFLLTILTALTSALGASSYYCEEPLLASLSPASFQSSSRSSDSHSPHFAKLHTRDGSGGWSPDSEDRRPWLQMDLRDRLEVTAVTTQGRWGSTDWVSSYQLQYSDSGKTWRSYRQENMPWTFTGNSDSDSVVQHKLLHSIRTRFLRLLPLEGNPTGGVGLRLEIYGCSYKSDVADFDGHSALLYRFNQKSTSTVKNVISVRFRSRQADGVLLHGEGQRGDYITLELQRGRLALHLNLDDAKPQSSARHTSVVMGSLLDDHLWHSVLIERFNKQVNFTVDKDMQHFRTQGQEDSLEVDYELSFGGIPLPGKPGTFLRENFHGCLENLYYNGVNIIDMAKRRKPQIYTVGNVTFSCSESQPVSVTFLSATRSFLVFPSDFAADVLSLRLQLRTWIRDGRLLTVPLSQGPKSSSLILQISDGVLLLVLRRFLQDTAQISTVSSVCDGQWHSVALELKGQQVYLTVDNQKPVLMEIPHLITSLQKTMVVFGACPLSQYELGCEKPRLGYQGCVRLLFLNNQPINLSRIQQEKRANFSELSFDICGIRDRCVPNFCEHGGVCYQTWDNFYCNCSGTGYMGSTCHNPIYERSCEAYRNTASPSGVFTIDPDGSGPLESTQVNCTTRGDQTWTVIGHDHLQPVSVQGSTPRSPYVLIFNYSISPYHIRSLVASSEHCQQEVTYRCRKSRLFDTWDGTPLSWWLDRDGVKRTYWGGSLPGVQQCSCSLEGNCRDMNYFCNCDADQETWVNDTGLLSYKDHLPLSEIAIGDVYYIVSCPPMSSGFLWNSASFFLESSYLHFPTLQAELSIDVSFYFKTSALSGLFLENVGVQDFIRLELSSPSVVTFTFDLGDGPVVLTVRSPVRLNDRQWHYLRAERNVKEASLQVDLLPLQVTEAAAEGQHRLQLNSQLFVGGAPTTQRGFLGCLRALSINGMTFDLNERAKVTPGMNSGCPGHCSRDSLCHNGGKCLENRNSYVCDCTHTAFTGANCKTAISASFERGTSVTYALQEPYSVMRNQDPKQQARNQHADMARSRENVAFGFLTRQVPALLLSAQSYDQRYMAIILTQNGSLQIWYRLNQETGPDTFRLKPANLADGRFHWVRINRDGDQLHVQIDNTVLQQYSLSPGSALAPVRILTLGRIRGSDITDEEVLRAGSRGFVGCLSSVQFNHASPLKAALQNKGSSTISVHGRLEESDCGTKLHPDPHVTPDEDSDESSQSDRGKAPLTKVAQSDSALIGGVVAGVVFTALCVLAVLIRFLYQHREPRPRPAAAVVKSKRPSLDVEPCKPSPVSKEYFI
ncbi:contactin-associated protein-like 5 [Silurus meridionalis]|uniref:contactin-associated protein-like 5 n=1 Tax=Silurus meridionalis TaxID=175797 RepID=UPI001EEBE95E|nr:contactin-associated protein-like 5 [Silurus meridionalis]